MKYLKVHQIIKTLVIILIAAPAIFTSCKENNDDEGGSTFTMSLTARSDGGDLTATDGLSLDADEVALTFTIASDGDWEIRPVSSNSSWMSLTVNRGNGNGSFVVNVSKNTTTSNRSVLLQALVKGKESAIYPLTQVAFGPNMAVEPAEPAEFTQDGGELTFSVASNATLWKYTQTGGEDWLTETELSPSGLKMAVAANSGPSRSATLTFSLVDYPAVTQIVTVSQAKYITVHTITLGSPAETSVEEVAAKDTIVFDWTSVNVSSYVLQISAAADMTNPIVSDTISTNSSSLDIGVLDSALFKAGTALGASGDFYWTVKPELTDEELTTALAPRKLTVKRPTLHTDVITGDMFDAVFNPDYQATDVSGKNQTISFNNPQYPFKVRYNRTYKRYMAMFSPAAQNTNKGAYYRMDYGDDFIAALTNGHSFECLVKFNHAYTGTDAYETKFFSSHGSGGTGFLVTNNSQATGANTITFLPNTGGYRWANSKIMPDGNRYYHLVGVYDNVAQKAILYVDGVEKANVDAPGTYQKANVKWLAIGGDAGGSIESCFQGIVVIARVYDRPLTAVEAAALYAQLQ